MEQSKPSEEHIKIESIKLNINGLVVELTVDKARALYKQLEELFGPHPSEIVWYPITQPQPYFGDTMPQITCTSIWINPNAEPFPERLQINYGAYGHSLTINS